MKNNFKNISNLLEHLFDNQYDMILDYLTIRLNKPFQKLPIIHLHGQELATGKSTFLKLLKQLFENDFVKTQPEEINNYFNSNWVDKKIVAFEEDSRFLTTERIKALTTAKELVRNQKYKDTFIIQSKLSFVVASNSEAIAHNGRIWNIKTKSLKKIEPFFDEKLKTEISFFKAYLENREVKSKEESRFWFSANSIENILKN